MKKLPEKWFISKCNNKEDWKKVIDFFNEGVGAQRYNGVSEGGFYYPNFFDFKGFREGYHSGCLSKHSNYPYIQYTEITMKHFKKHILKEENMMKEFIGYKLKENCKCYKKAVLSLINREEFYSKEHGSAVDVAVTLNIEILKSAGVLDLWFDAVYKEIKPKCKVGDYEVTPQRGAVEINNKRYTLAFLKSVKSVLEAEHFHSLSFRYSGQIKVTKEMIDELIKIVKK